MRRIICLLLCFLLIFALASCNSTRNEQNSKSASSSASAENTNSPAPMESENSSRSDIPLSFSKPTEVTERPSTSPSKSAQAPATTPCITGKTEQGDELQMEKETIRKIRVQANGNTIVFELNNSRAAIDLYSQLPLNIKVENYSANEKIFYPPKKLDTTDTPLADAQAGTLAYYAPWGNVVMFYDSFGTANGLYELGRAVLGKEWLEGLSGMIQIEKLED